MPDFHDKSDAIIPLAGDLHAISATPPNHVPSEAGPTGNNALKGTLARRWPLILGVWLLIGGGLSAYVWKHFPQEYEAVGMVRVAPTISRIVFRDDDDNMLPYYGPFLKTQMELTRSKAVLKRAVALLDQASFTWAPPDVDPVEYLTEELEIDNPDNTELVSVTLPGRDPKVLAPVVNAVLDAYMEKVKQQDASADTETLELLYQKQSGLETELKSRHDDLYALAAQFGALSLGSQQDAAVAGAQQIQLELKKAQAARIAAEARLRAAREQGPRPLPAEDLARLRGELAAGDPDLAGLLFARQLDEQKLIQGAQQLGPAHREMKAARDRVAQIEQRMAARQVALGSVVAEQAAYRAQSAYQTQLRDVEQTYAAAVQQEQALLELVKEESASLAAMGHNAVQLQALRDKAAQTQQLYDAVRDRIQHLEMERQRPARISIDAKAVEPTSPAKDKRPKFTILVVGMGLFLAMFVGAVVDARDTSLRCEADVRRELGLNLVGTRTIPRARSRTDRAVLASLTEEIRGIRGCVLVAGECREVRSVLITSANPREGKTRMAADLAVALAESGRRVLLIDADNRKRDLTRLFGADGRPGLSTLLADGCEGADVICSTSTADLSFLPAGKEHDQFSELLVRPGQIDRVRRCFLGYDLIVVDSPPVLLSNEPGIWARHVDSVLMVVRAKFSARADAVAAKDRLSQMGGRIMGAVLNGAPCRAGYYRRYGY